MRQLVAALACSMQSTRLYGKPLQRLDVVEGVTILDQIVSLTQTLSPVKEVVLAVSEASGNEALVEFAKRRGLRYILGSQSDVLYRLIQCGHFSKGTDILRLTTENPFFYFEMVDVAWKRHLEMGNDVTTTEGLPDGCDFEIYRIESLEMSHSLGDARHRSEYCSLYIREHRDDFIIEVLPIPSDLERNDLRLTVDNPEDLILCRRVYASLKHKAPRIPIAEIIKLIDDKPEMMELVDQYVENTRIWDE